MTPKEKAKDLVSNHFDIIANATGYKGLSKDATPQNIGKFKSIEKVAKQSAIICVNEILDIDNDRLDCDYNFWGEVKQEIEKL